MVFHAGVLFRLNEAAVLPKLARISSVSGGSITAGALAMAWPRLEFRYGKATRLDEFVALIRAVADVTVDMPAIIGGLLLPGSISGRVAAAYDRLLFRGATLQDLPDDHGGAAPRFVFNATNMQTSALWRFSRPYMGDYRVGLVHAPLARLCDVVAASSAFPPLLSPATLAIKQAVAAVPGADLSRPPFTREAILSDGGVYDNLGLETLKGFATVLVSDAGQKIGPQEQPRRNWIGHAMRVFDTVDNQVRSLRKRQLMASYRGGALTGCYWGIRTDVADYGNPDDPLGARSRDPSQLAALPTRLKRMPRSMQDRLMNWGYAVCDTALRTHVTPALQEELGISIGTPAGFPFPGSY